ncbi:hypothetical protein [Paenibacillus hamazuiensis]|uniref:hypothetical protein n=1 Tax=Paenibacillus hamazuiensis TaxID=2936508 RepID=UPI00200E4222|nr:hypothetical protein [Paenibacillus hamazuiensis]
MTKKINGPVRSDADYNTEVFFDREIAEEFIQGVVQFNTCILRLIEDAPSE